MDVSASGNASRTCVHAAFVWTALPLQTTRKSGTAPRVQIYLVKIPVLGGYGASSESHQYICGVLSRIRRCQGHPLERVVVAG